MKLSKIQMAQAAAKLQEELAQLLCQDGHVRSIMRDAKIPEGRDEGDLAVADHIRALAGALGNGLGLKVKAVLDAKAKLAEGSLGTCEMCEEDIPLARILAVPSARYCIECQRSQEPQDRRALRV